MTLAPRVRAGLLASIATGFILVSASLRGQAYEVLTTFDAFRGEPMGRMVEASPGVFYGTILFGGRWGRGSVFRLTTSPAVELEEIHELSGANGISPIGLTLGPAGYAYGTSSGTGLANGTIFRMDETGRLTAVHAFGNTPFVPGGELLHASDGHLYGTNPPAGPDSVGTIFRVEDDGSITTLHAFNGLDGARPEAPLFQASDGWIYGTTLATGPMIDGPGTIFRISLQGQFELLYTLSGADGLYMSAGLVEGPDGLLYGGTFYGGAYGYGTIFRIDGAGNFEKIHDLDNMLGEGSDIRDSLILSSDGNLWGVAYQGANGGTIFKISTAGDWTTVHSFNATEVVYPSGSLLLGSDGWMYGTAQQAASPAYGGVYRVAVDGTFEVLAKFNHTAATKPSLGVVEGPDGYLYGGTEQDGAYGYGALFRVSPSGALEYLHDFAGPEGRGECRLMRASDGTLYGVTSQGGASDRGTIFRYDTPSGYTVLHEFDETEGANPRTPLIEATDGDFYGATSAGGADGLGTIFRFSTGDTLGAGGALTTIKEIAPEDGNFPTSLIQASDDMLYGTLGAGPFAFQGSVFRLDLSGANFENLAPFAGPEGVAPNALTQADGGDFFGTAYFGGAHAGGTVFRFEPPSDLTAEHSFTGGPDGFAPLSGVLPASDGNLYGTASQGAATTYGTLFRFTGGAGPITTLWTFHGLDGARPQGPLHEASDGAIYGTAFGGFGFSEGIVFRWLLSSESPAVAEVQPTSGPAAGGTSVEVRGTHFQTVPIVSIGGVPAPVVAGMDAQLASARTPTLAPGSLNDVTLTNPDTTTATLPGAWFADFLDVDSRNIYHDSVESIVRAGITAGCSSGNYCVSAPVTRAQMAVFLLKAKYGSAHVPPNCTGVFDDVLCPGPFTNWIEQLAAEGITAGCDPGLYCPDNPVTRAQMAVFLLKTKEGSGHAPPASTGIFEDVPPGSFAADWIEELYARGITGGCSISPLLYCPATANTRGQMAVFLQKTFELP
jgi:uncharacterized repeat protein (TIGR03803 family)